MRRPLLHLPLRLRRRPRLHLRLLRPRRLLPSELSLRPEAPDRCAAKNRRPRSPRVLPPRPRLHRHRPHPPWRPSLQFLRSTPRRVRPHLRRVAKLRRVRPRRPRASPFRRPRACVRPHRPRVSPFRRPPAFVATFRPLVVPVVPVRDPAVRELVPVVPVVRVPVVPAARPAAPVVVPAAVSVAVQVVPAVLAAPVVPVVVVPVAVVVPVVVPADRVARSAARVVVVAVRTNSSPSMHRATPRARRPCRSA